MTMQQLIHALTITLAGVVISSCMQVDRSLCYASAADRYDSVVDACADSGLSFDECTPLIAANKDHKKEQEECR